MSKDLYIIIIALVGVFLITMIIGLIPMPSDIAVGAYYRTHPRPGNPGYEEPCKIKDCEYHR
jgi:hypothetical protein